MPSFRGYMTTRSCAALVAVAIIGMSGGAMAQQQRHGADAGRSGQSDTRGGGQSSRGAGGAGGAGDLEGVFRSLDDEAERASGAGHTEDSTRSGRAGTQQGAGEGSQSKPTGGSKPTAAGTGKGGGKAGSATATDAGETPRKGTSGGGSKPTTAGTGKGGGKAGSATATETGHGAGKGSSAGGAGRPADAGEGDEEDSDRPAWAGPNPTEDKPGRPNANPGVSKGDTYGDLYVVVRDEDGVPVLVDGYLQLKDAEGNVVAYLKDGEFYAEIGGDLLTDPEVEALNLAEVELGRLNVGRSPTTVLESRYEEVESNLSTAVSISLDASGRLVIEAADGTTKTVDAPLENLALYVDLMTNGALFTDNEALQTLLVDSGLGFLVDGTFDSSDLEVAASLLAASSDKAGEIIIDEVVYMNDILGIEGTLDGGYVDYSAFTYDRASVYQDVTVEVLVAQTDADGNTTWVPQTVMSTTRSSKAQTSPATAPPASRRPPTTPAQSSSSSTSMRFRRRSSELP